MLTKEEILQIFKDTGALMEGHFVLTSGLHSAMYIEKFRILEQPRYTEMLCSEIAENYRSKNIDVVVGPMTGGIILAYEVGRQLETKAIFTERVDGKMKFRRGFNLSSKDNVLIVEDIITTGGSVFEVIDEVKNFGSNIIGISCLVDRSPDKIGVNSGGLFDYPFKPLLTLDITTYKPEECPLCKSGTKAVKPGSR
jgi:orotate phosphoribosyltransferase